MWEKLKSSLMWVVGGIVSILAILLKIQTERVKSLKAEKQALEAEKRGRFLALEEERKARSRQDEIRSMPDGDIDSRFNDLFK